MFDDTLPNQPKTGRGAIGNQAGRFEQQTAQAIDDGWLLADDENAGAKVSTHLHIDTSRAVINTVDSPDLPFMRSINPYRGCEHGCIYCYARPTHGYLGLSSGLDFETEIFYKPDAPAILRQELAAKNYAPLPITLGSNTDCYQPVERELQLTRRLVQVLHDHDHPLIVITKSALVARDIDLLAPMAARGLARVNISLTTLDHDLARVMEPRTAAPHKRLATIRALVAVGIPVTVMVAPLIPGLTDHELEELLTAASDAGATQAHYTLVRLPHEVKDLFSEWLHAHRPDRAARVLSLIRQMRGGKLYDASFATRRTGTGPYAELIANRFRLAKQRLGFNDESYAELRTDLFRQPESGGQLRFGF